MDPSTSYDGPANSSIPPVTCRGPRPPKKDLSLVMRPCPKSDRWVLTEVLVEAGLTLITDAENSREMSKRGQARQVRNGLMLAMLAMHPIRLKNFATLEIGRSFLDIKSSWWIVLSAS